MIWLIVLSCVLYVVAALVTVCHLHDDLDMAAGHAWLGGVIWPWVMFRGIQNGYLTNFVKKLEEAVNRD
jgi:Flp pilus assembly protein TadB